MSLQTSSFKGDYSTIVAYVWTLSAGSYLISSVCHPSQGDVLSTALVFYAASQCFTRPPGRYISLDSLLGLSPTDPRSSNALFPYMSDGASHSRVVSTAHVSEGVSWIMVRRFIQSGDSGAEDSGSRFEATERKI